MLPISIQNVFSKSTEGFVTRNLSLMNFSAFGPNEHHPEAALRAVSQAEMDVWSACAI